MKSKDFYEWVKGELIHHYCDFGSFASTLTEKQWDELLAHACEADIPLLAIFIPCSHCGRQITNPTLDAFGWKTEYGSDDSHGNFYCERCARTLRGES